MTHRSTQLVGHDEAPGEARECQAQPPRSGGDAPSEPARGRRRIEHDDLGVDLPDEGSTDETSKETDDAWDPEDDSDLGLATDDGSEDVGLDTSTGLDDGPDADGELDDTGEGVRWTTDSEADEDLPGDDDSDLMSDAEDGWLGDDDTSDDDDDFDPGIEDEPPSSSDDGGVEGVDDDTELDDLDLGALPDIDADTEEDADGLGSDGLEELSELAVADEPAIEVAPGAIWKELAASATRRTLIGELDAKAQALAALGSWIVVAGQQLSLVENRKLGAAPGLALGDRRARRVALCDHGGRARIAVATDAELMISSGAGLTQLMPATLRATDVAFTDGARGARLWALTDQGALQWTSDDGASWSETTLPGRVHAFGTDGQRRVIAVCAGATGTALVIAQSSDGGQHFAQHALDAAGLQPNVADELRVLVCRSASALVLPDAVLCASGDAAFVAPLPSARAPATLLDEDDELVLYACVPHQGRVLLVRHALRGGQVAPTIIASLDPAETGAPRLLTAAHAEGLVTLHVATDRRLYRIEASLDGDALPPRA
jgi:hypothetical protein